MAAFGGVFGFGLYLLSSTVYSWASTWVPAYREIPRLSPAKPKLGLEGVFMKQLAYPRQLGIWNCLRNKNDSVDT